MMTQEARDALEANMAGVVTDMLNMTRPAERVYLMQSLLRTATAALAVLTTDQLAAEFLYHLADNAATANRGGEYALAG